MGTFFGFRNGKLITVVLSTVEGYEDAIDVDYVIEDPENAERQIEAWKKK